MFINLLIIKHSINYFQISIIIQLTNPCTNNCSRKYLDFGQLRILFVLLIPHELNLVLFV